ncbi:hypothetical protein KY290_007924 [Solanum tuberosum]|uniref:Uncharacterized protein n=1 Tax=Solanum tuberosum TaxID=4113 RepID=A0ABQ7W6X7_SOLTU|nr:hypothetical protein KY290_007924 [Solanum tuberosum]
MDQMGKLELLPRALKDIALGSESTELGGWLSYRLGESKKFMKLAVYFAMKAFQLVIILNSPPLRRYCDTMCPWPLAVNGKLRIDYQGVEICLERPWRRETMHNLVKEAGIDFKNFGDDLNAAKEHDIKQLIFLVFEMVVEPKLLQPTIVLEYLHWPNHIEGAPVSHNSHLFSDTTHSMMTLPLCN